MYCLRNVEWIATLFLQAGLQGTLSQNHVGEGEDAGGILCSGVQTAQGVAQSESGCSIGVSEINHV